MTARVVGTIANRRPKVSSPPAAIFLVGPDQESQKIVAFSKAIEQFLFIPEIVWLKAGSKSSASINSTA